MKSQSEMQKGKGQEIKVGLCGFEQEGGLWLWEMSCLMPKLYMSCTQCPLW